MIRYCKCNKQMKLKGQIWVCADEKCWTIRFNSDKPKPEVAHHLM